MINKIHDYKQFLSIIKLLYDQSRILMYAVCFLCIFNLY